MSEEITLSTAGFEKIIKNLVLLEEEYPRILEQYYPVLTSGREEFLDRITQYVRKLNQVVQEITVREDASHEFPFVVLGSCVEMEDMEDSALYRYRIVCPSKRSLEQGCVSLVSPIGTALLLKKVNEEVSVETPGGVYRYRIRSVTLE